MLFYLKIKEHCLLLGGGGFWLHRDEQEAESPFLGLSRIQWTPSRLCVSQPLLWVLPGLFCTPSLFTV